MNVDRASFKTLLRRLLVTTTVFCEAEILLSLCRNWIIFFSAEAETLLSLCRTGTIFSQVRPRHCYCPYAGTGSSSPPRPRCCSPCAGPGSRSSWARPRTCSNIFHPVRVTWCTGPWRGSLHCRAVPFFSSVVFSQVATAVLLLRSLKCVIAGFYFLLRRGPPSFSPSF